MPRSSFFGTGSWGALSAETIGADVFLAFSTEMNEAISCCEGSRRAGRRTTAFLWDGGCASDGVDCA